MSNVQIIFEPRFRKFIIDPIQLSMVFFEAKPIVLRLLAELNQLQSRLRIFDPTFVIIIFGVLIVSAYLCIYYWYLFSIPIICGILIIFVMILNVCRWRKLKSDVTRVIVNYQNLLVPFYGIQNAFNDSRRANPQMIAVVLFPLDNQPVLINPTPAPHQVSFIPIYDYGIQNKQSAIGSKNYKTYQPLPDQNIPILLNNIRVEEQPNGVPLWIQDHNPEENYKNKSPRPSSPILNHQEQSILPVNTYSPNRPEVYRPPINDQSVTIGFSQDIPMDYNPANFYQPTFQNQAPEKPQNFEIKKDMGFRKGA